MIRVRSRERVSKPSACDRSKAVSGSCKVLLVARPCVLRLVEKLDLRLKDGDPRRVPPGDRGEGPAHGRISEKQPVGSFALVEEQLEVPVGVAHGSGPQGVEARLGRGAGSNERQSSVGGAVELPAGECARQGGGVAPQAAHVEVAMAPDRASHEALDRPASGEPPAARDSAKPIGGFLRRRLAPRRSFQIAHSDRTLVASECAARTGPGPRCWSTAPAAAEIDTDRGSIPRGRHGQPLIRPSST